MESAANPYRDLSDDELLAQCRIEFQRASGPGGQHRNKVETAVRLSHLETGITVLASEYRSQWRNRLRALERLRERLEKRFHRDAPRVPTRKSRGRRKREVETKRRHGEKKRTRTKPAADD